MTPRPPIPSFIPESAPFTPEQRTWLNGLFAGVFGLQESVTPLSTVDAAKLLAGLIGGTRPQHRPKPTTARRGTIPPCRCRIA
jgi:sulfite reductase (NADPH) flavoprotein alpha-component